MSVSNSRVFIDTNILFYANDLTEAFGLQAINRINELAQLNNELFISPQTLKEYANVTLRNAVYHKLDLPPNITIVRNNIIRFQRDFQMIFENQDSVDKWLNLLPMLTTSKDVFDFSLASIIISNSIPYILTHNTSDFVKFNSYFTVLPLFP